jgi:aminoglycoside 6'-N-acetyltransferase I
VIEPLRIVDLRPDAVELVRQAAAVLVAAFAEHYPGSWDDLPSALAEVRESFGAGRISRVALDADGRVAGWIGAIRGYGGNAWELHPLAVRPDAQGRGVGRALVRDLEALARERGATTLYLGTDDEDGRTSVSGIDLYPDVLEHARHISNPGRHPYGFYEKLGFVVVGLLPDANGFGKPDILMAKRVG